jgi:DNA-binding beta-propeller fold protein YncE
MKPSSKHIVFGLLAFATFASAGTVRAQKPYSILTRWKVGGTGGWDYLTSDPKAHRLYVTHGTRVEVLDSDSGKVLGSITDLKGTHGVALDTAGRYGYISDGGANAVVVFDRQSLARVTSIPAGTNPDGIVFEPTTQTVWAFNGRSQNVTVIDSKAQKTIATIALSGKPEFPVADGSGTVFANIESTNEIDRFNAETRAITAKWPLPLCESPSGLALDAKGRRLFAVCHGNKMAVVDAVSGKTLATPTIGDGPDAARYDARRNLAFSSNGDGTLTIVNAGKSGYPVSQNLATQQGARTMALDEASGHLFLATASFGERPAPTTENPNPRPAVVPDTFTILVVGQK